jgi:hypothetical protein
MKVASDCLQTQVLRRAFACYVIHVSFLFVLFLDPKDGSKMFHRNICWRSTDYVPEDRTLNIHAVRTLNPKIDLFGKRIYHSAVQ